MAVRTILAVVAVFVVMSGLDVVVHGFLLAPTFGVIASFWRPPRRRPRKIPDLNLLQ